MHIIKSLKRLRVSTKQLVVASAFLVALGTAVSLGFATKQKTSAATYNPDCTNNAILTCGATDPGDFINKVRSNNGGRNGDLQALYASYGLSGTDYDRFVREAKEGVAMRDGRIVVDGQTVATDAWSIGRNKKANSWNQGGYWADSAQNVNRSDIPVMVLFDENGAMQFAVMHPCGNATAGNVIKPAFDCKALSKSPVEGEKDTYMFTVDAPASNGATVAKVVYNFGDGSSETRTDLGGVKHKFTKPGNYTVSVSVTFNLPGGKQKTVEGLKCRTSVTVVAPFYACVQLVPTVLNDKKTQFRFTVKTSQGNGATLKDIDFTLDDKNTLTGVVTKDAQGNIYQEYTFAEDGAKHKVVAKVNFNLDSGVASKTCEATVTSTKAPMCTVPGKEMFPPNAPECAYCDVPGKETLPKDSKECVKPQVLAAKTELPNTGMGNVVGLFAGTSVAGAAARHLVVSRRRRS